MKKLSEIFNYWYGVNLEFINCVEDSNGIPFVSRTSKNNGVVGRVLPLPNVEPNPANTISLAGGGSVLSCFYQDEPYYSGRDLFVLSPKKEMDKDLMLLYSYIISSNKYKYNYGRQANKTFKDLLLPEPHEIEPLINFSYSNFKFDKSPILNSILEFEPMKWQWFKISEILNKPYKAKSYNAQDLAFTTYHNMNAIRYVTRTDENNGIKGFVEDDNYEYIEDGNAITIGDTTSTIFYQDKPFICGDHVVVLRSPNLNKYIGIFLVTLLNLEKYRYCYGKSFKMDTIKKTLIKLPTDKDGAPDWKYMENYIKSLPFSSNL